MICRCLTSYLRCAVAGFASAVIVAAVFFGAAAEAASSNRVETERATSVVVTDRNAFAPGETVWFALSQKLALGWHVYWKNPGDSGLPLDLRWRTPPGISIGEVVYPSPERIFVGPFANFGHHGDPIFLVPVRLDGDAKIGGDIDITIEATWLICEEICVPEEGAFTLSLPVAESAPRSAQAALINEGFRRAPTHAATDASFDAQPETLTITVDLGDQASPADLSNLVFFPEVEGLIEPAAEQSAAFENGVLTISLKPAGAYDPDALSEVRGVLGAEDGARGQCLIAVREGEAFRGCEDYASTTAFTAAPVRPVASGGASGSANAAGGLDGGLAGNMGGGLFFLLAAAFFGGILLNVMPCVFPVVFIKAASLIDSAGEADGGAVARRHGLLYGVGVIASFAVLGGLLLILRAGSEQVGWGFQLQSPAVVLISAYILFLVGLNLAGVFDIGESLQGAGGGLAAKQGGAGAFFTGMLAVLVAAPCIGPLLSAPMGAAVFLPPLWGMLIFLLIGAGLALPYVALSFSPALGRLLPRPGPWMKTFKQALAFPVFAAAAFFLWVLAQQSGPSGLAFALSGAVFLAMAAWLFELSKTSPSRGLIWRAAAAGAAAAALAPLVSLRSVPAAPVQTARADVVKSHGAFEAYAYSPQMLAELRAAGSPVFVDFTAAWCVTCQFNKATLFSRPSLARSFSEAGVAVMVADWTLRDDAITDALETFGANGVPLYVFYPPSGAPQVLPLPLSERSILNAISASPKS